MNSVSVADLGLRLLPGCLVNSQAYAMESQTFVLHCTAIFSETGIKIMGTAGSPVMGSPNTGTSAVVGPDGRVLVGGVKKDSDGSAKEELILADLDMGLITKNKTFADASGHYSRPDLMWLGVERGRKEVVRTM